MRPTVYYNENDPFAAAWLRELVKAGLIAPGVVDERSIEDVRPVDLAGFVQCHFFAGIGVWSYALRCAGWPDDRPVWTGSCPCQPFSDAGKGQGFADERHLWPAWFHLISQCRPLTVAGEQVASKHGLAWLDLVQTDLENAGYACGAVDSCSAGYGAPHIRQRLYWLAHDAGVRSGAGFCHYAAPEQRRNVAPDSGAIGGLDYHNSARLAHEQTQNPRQGRTIGRSSAPCGLENSGGNGCRPGRDNHPEHDGRQFAAAGQADRPGPVNGFWRNADWLSCKDDKWRPVEPGTFPLADGIANRVGLLRGYGNALNAIQATEFIRAAMDVLEARA